jgi:hypothetical protein
MAAFLPVVILYTECIHIIRVPKRRLNVYIFRILHRVMILNSANQIHVREFYHFMKSKGCSEMDVNNLYTKDYQ